MTFDKMLSDYAAESGEAASGASGTTNSSMQAPYGRAAGGASQNR